MTIGNLSCVLAAELGLQRPVVDRQRCVVPGEGRVLAQEGKVGPRDRGLRF
jgi:hypothetical protein